jgi:hypothetical protein
LTIDWIELNKFESNLPFFPLWPRLEKPRTTIASLFLPLIILAAIPAAPQLDHVTPSASTSTSTTTMASAPAIKHMDAETEAVALADIHDEEQLEQKLKALYLKADARRSPRKDEEVKEAAAPTKVPSDEQPMPEERWNPHWQSNLKLLQVRRLIEWLVGLIGN